MRLTEKRRNKLESQEYEHYPYQLHCTWITRYTCTCTAPASRGNTLCDEQNNYLIHFSLDFGEAKTADRIRLGVHWTAPEADSDCRSASRSDIELGTQQLFNRPITICWLSRQLREDLYHPHYIHGIIQYTIRKYDTNVLYVPNPEGHILAPVMYNSITGWQNGVHA